MFGILMLALASSPARAGQLYSCDQTTLIDPALMQHVDFTATNAGSVKQAQVLRVSTGLPEIGPRHVAWAPNYDGGYWLTNYGLDSYRIGWAMGDKYMLLVPQPPWGSQVDIEVHTLFGGGAYGWMQNEFHCVQVP